MFDRFSEPARAVLSLAREAAVRRRAPAIEPEHVLLAMLDEPSGAGAALWKGAGADLASLRAEIENRPSTPGVGGADDARAWSPRGVRLLERAVAAADARGSREIGLDHLASALARDDGSAGAAIEASGADKGALIVDATRRRAMRDEISKDTRTIMGRARAEAIRLRHDVIGTEHVLASILATGDPGVVRALEALGVEEAELRSAMHALTVKGAGKPVSDERQLPLAHEVKRALDRAVAAAGEFCSKSVEPAHLLVGLAAEEKGLAGQVLRSFGADARRIMAVFAGESAPPRPAAEVREAPLSVCIITMNEAENLPRCLDSLKLVRPDEIVVLDSGSADATRDIAAAAGARVFVEPFPGHIEQKNRALDLATHDWVLCVDADEAVSAELAGEIRRVLARPGAASDAFSVRRRNRYLGRWIRHGGFYPDRKVRLFRKSRGRWGGVNPHDKVIVEGPVEKLDGDLLHRSYRDLSHHVKTIDSFTTVMARERAARGRRFSFFRLLFEPPARFVRMYFLQLGFLDGMAGFIAAWNAAYYVFLRHAKQYESERAGEPPETR